MPAVRSRPKLRLKLEEQIDMILPSPAAAIAPSAPLCAALTPAPDALVEEREPFGRWLTAQPDRGDWIDALADAARKDTRFPKNGSPDDVRKHLNAMQAEGDMFEAVDDAEMDWLSC
jgi:hypothetical protein